MALLKIKRKGEKTPQAYDEADILPLDHGVLGISDQAVAKIRELNNETPAREAYFRVGIKGGGCSGMTIHYALVDKATARDRIFDKDGVSVCIDEKSLSILGGSTLHFRARHGSGEFVLVNNPAAKQCGCGQSFTL